MAGLDLAAVCIVCATALVWHAISRHYAERDMSQMRGYVDAAVSLVDRAREHADDAGTYAKVASECAKEARVSAETATSAESAREHAKVLIRLENLEARAMRR